MKFHRDAETYGVETTQTDLKVAQTLGDVLASARDLTHDYYEVTDDGTERGACHYCEAHRLLRPLGVVADDGQPFVAGVCAECQAGIVEQNIRQANADEQSVEEAAQPAETGIGTCPACEGVGTHPETDAACQVCGGTGVSTEPGEA